VRVQIYVIHFKMCRIRHSNQQGVELERIRTTSFE